MGKGQIVSGGENGQYQVKLIYAYRSRVQEKITKMQQNITAYQSQITTLDAQISAEADIKKKEALILRKSIINLQITSLQKQISYFQNNMPADPTVTAWCMDFTENLSGYVGTAEIPGEKRTVLIRPGYDGRATYTTARDGQLMPSIAGEPNQVLFNWMLLPGWQRHKPIYRIGKIIPDSLDFGAHTCSICLDPDYSSQQSLPVIDGLVVGDCNMGDDTQSEYLTNASEDFCARNPTHPFCTQNEGSEISLTDAMLAQLKAVNYSVNSSYSFAADKSGNAVGDKWDVMSPGGAGDCEDFALTKMQKLVDDYGWNPDNLNLVTAYMKDGQYHAMLGVRTSNRGLVLLDCNYNEVMLSGRVPYRIDKVATASDSWKNYTRRLDAVPIEYMGCNSYAFADEDRVIVQFTSQDWAQPKVIGFLEEPEECETFIWRHGIVGVAYSGVWKYAITANVWTQGVYTPEGRANYGWPNSRAYVYSVDAIAFDDRRNQWIFGGLRSNWYCPAYAKKCLKFMTGSEAYLARADHPSPGRPGGQCSWYLNGGSYLIGGYLIDGCYPDGPDGEYVTYGLYTQDDNDFFNDTTNTWTSKTSLPNEKEYAFDFAISGFGYVGGGKDDTTDEYFSSFDSYDPIADTWIGKTALPRNLAFAQGAELNGKGYSIMGLSDTQYSGDSAFNDSGVGRSVWNTKWLSEFDPLMDTWSAKSQGFYKHILGGAVGIDGAVWSNYIGEDPNQFTYLGSLQRYDPLTESWTKFEFLYGDFPGWDHSRLAR